MPNPLSCGPSNEAIVHQPETGSELKGNLAGYRSWKVHVKGSGEYRVLYHVDFPLRRVVVHWIGTRENFYEEAERHVLG